MEIKPNYADITNYLRNELEITRDYIEKVVERSIANTVKQFLAQKITEGQMDRIINSTVQATITDTTSTWNRQSTKDDFSKAVQAEIRKHTGKILSEGFEIAFVVKPKETTNED